MMGERISRGSYFQYPPPGFPSVSPHRPSSIRTDRERSNFYYFNQSNTMFLLMVNNGRYLAELFTEKEKLGPFTQVLPQCTGLLNQEIRRVSGFSPSLLDHERFEHDSPIRSFGHHPNGRQMDLEGWSIMQTEENGHLQRVAPVQAASMGWPGLPGAPTRPLVKKVVRLNVPVDQYPSYNFVGRILGPRGNSLKRVEAVTECRVYIRGKGSVKDSVKV
ncbi:hypothetical protein Golob_003014, partial [Gossypium lobatum]|nr:hypothetical protein [Gossypium lobatum]